MNRWIIFPLFFFAFFIYPTFVFGADEFVLPKAYLPNVQIRAGELAMFDCGHSSDSLGRPIVEYRLDFGNGRSDSFSSPAISYRYFDEGSFTASLVVVTDDKRVSVPDTATVTVAPANRLPVLSCEKEIITGVVGRSFYVPITVSDLDNDRVVVVGYGDEGEDPGSPRSLVSSTADFLFTFSTIGSHFLTFVPSDEYGPGGALVVRVLVFDDVSITARYYKKRNCIEIDASKCERTAVLTFTLDTLSGSKNILLPVVQDGTPRIYYFFGFQPREYADYSVTSSLGGSCTGYLISY